MTLLSLKRFFCFHPSPFRRSRNGWGTTRSLYGCWCFVKPHQSKRFQRRLKHKMQKKSNFWFNRRVEMLEGSSDSVLQSRAWRKFRVTNLIDCWILNVNLRLFVVKLNAIEKNDSCGFIIIELWTIIFYENPLLPDFKIFNLHVVQSDTSLGRFFSW